MPVLRVSHSAVVDVWRGREDAFSTRRRAATVWADPVSAEAGLQQEREHRQEPLRPARRAG